MSDLPKATSRRDLIKRFKELGWTGPFPGRGPHPEYMEREGRVCKLPNPHSRARGDIGEGLLKIILQQADMTHNMWLGKEDQ